MNKEKIINDLLAIIEIKEKALERIATMEKGPYFYSDRFYQMKEIAQKALEGK